MNDKEITAYVEEKLSCAIKIALAEGIPITKGTQYRAVARPHGFTTHYWDYRRRANTNAINTTYALDLIIIGKQVNMGEGRATYAIGRALLLPNKQLASCLDNGFSGHDFEDCDIRHAPLSRPLYDTGRRLRAKFRL